MGFESKGNHEVVLAKFGRQENDLLFYFYILINKSSVDHSLTIIVSLCMVRIILTINALLHLFIIDPIIFSLYY